MKEEVRTTTLVLCALLLVLTPVFADYEENIREDIFLVRPDNQYIPETDTPVYLADEDLIFFACLEADDTPIRLSLLCIDNNEFEDIRVVQWGNNNCYIGSTNLEKFDCTKARVQADYVADGENLKLTKTIRINKFAESLTRVVQTQFEDGGWQTPLDTAFGLYVLNQFPEIFPERIDLALDYLKFNRNETDKCWPDPTCKISTTANILFMLEKAGFEDLRIQNDGKIYLEKTQNYLRVVNWSVTVGDHLVNTNNTLNTTCVLEYDEDLTVFNLSRYPSIKNFSFDPEYGNHVGVVCTEAVYVRLQNEFDEQLIGYQGDNFSYEIPEACWTKNNENIECDVRATLLAVGSNIASGQKSSAISYLNNLVVDDRTAGKHVTEDINLINDALYYHSVSSNTADLEEGLLFRQANNGSWHLDAPYYENTFYEASDDEVEKTYEKITDQVSWDIITTGYIVMGLIENDYDREDEVILDAERYVSIVEDDVSLNFTDEDLEEEENVRAYQGNRSLILNDTKRNAMAFYTLQNNARPFLRANPRILILSEASQELDIINPTIFELEEIEYELTDELNRILDVEEKDYVGAYSFRRITITRKDDATEEEFGYLRISKNDDEYLKLPIIVLSKPELNISLPTEITVFGATAILPFKVDKSLHNYTCSLEWSTQGISSSSAFNINEINDTYNYPVRFASLSTESVVYEGIITCIASSVTFKIPIATNIIRFSNKPLEVTPRFINFNTSNTPESITVTNKLDQSIDVDIALANYDPEIVVSEPFITLYPGETRNITVEIIPTTGENYTSSNAILFKTFSIEERTILDIEIIYQPEQTTPWWILVAIAAALFLALGGIGYLIWKRRDAVIDWYEKTFHQESLQEKVTKQVRELEAEEQQLAIRNMMKILKLQGLKDIEVRNRLLAEGYTETEIDYAITAPTKKENEETKPGTKKTS